MLDNALPLKVAGIIRTKAGSANANINTPVAYTSALTEYCIDRENGCEIIKEQEANPDINVLTGVPFSAADEETRIADARDYLTNLTPSDKAAMYNMIMYYGLLSGGDNETGNYNLGSLINMVTGGESVNLAAILGFGEATAGTAILSSLIAGETSVSDETLASLMDTWLQNKPNRKILLSIYDDYVAGGTYDENMVNFGKVSYDSPSSISIYADTFEQKDNITACIEKYNENVPEEEKIVYTDYIAMITSSITTIINAISYILIAFVAVSLIVSCIMIGIITHISVLERTREIGTLRALGASKKNVAQVFNAETVIIGLFAGLIGIAVSLLLGIPINAILKSTIGSDTISVHLSFVAALILIAISVIVTVIGGIIPAAHAARKDPVVALRSE